MIKTRIAASAASAMLAAALAGCAGGAASTQEQADAASSAQTSTVETQSARASNTGTSKADAAAGEADATVATSASTTASAASANASASILAIADLFTDRDLEQTAEASGATAITLADNTDVNITEEGVYVVSGTATNATIRVEADSAAKVQIVLDGATITNESAPAIYVVSADKVFVTTAADSTLSTTGTFTDSDGEGVDAVVYTKDDIVLNGTANLAISSTGKGVNAKDDLKITGGTYTIDAADHALDANDSVCIADGELQLTANGDGIHCTNDGDGTLGYVYIGGGTITVNAADKGIEASSVVQVDDGSLSIAAAEGIEGTYVQINGGTLEIDATDDAINATPTSASYTATIEFNGGQSTITIAQGDTDALDSNGNLFINGGTIDITAQHPFDYDGEGALGGGEVYVNGERVTELANATTKPL